MPEERPVYGCVGADRPEAQPYIDEVDGVLFFKNHFEGGYLFRDMVTLEATPSADAKGTWKVEYQFASQRDQAPKLAELTRRQGEPMIFEIPVEQPTPPGIKARLRVEARFWNDGHA